MLTISGASDDIVEIDGVAFERDSEDDNPVLVKGAVAQGLTDEIGCTGQEVQITIGRDEASEGRNAEGIRVWMRYTDIGVWSAQILPIEEDVPCPWDIRVSVNEYTTIVKVDAPLGTPVVAVRVEA